MKTTVTTSTGDIKEVKNLGWLLRHARSVTVLVLSERDDGARRGLKLTAHLTNGSKYETSFNDSGIAWRWIKRPSLSRAIIYDLQSDRETRHCPES